MSQPPAPTNDEISKVYTDHQAMLAASKALEDKLTDQSSDDEKEKVRQSYRPFFKALCKRYGRLDDVPIPSGTDLMAMRMRSPWFSMTKYLDKHPPLPNHALLMQRALSSKHEVQEAWKTSYIGDAPSLLRDYINDIAGKRQIFERPLTGENAGYANFCAIIQGSGTGKSRLVDQLAEHVFTIPFVLRKATDKSEAVVEAFSVKRERSASWLQRKDLLLLLRSLDYAKTWIKAQDKNLDTKALIQNFPRIGAVSMRKVEKATLIRSATALTLLQTSVIKYATAVVELLKERLVHKDEKQYTYILFSFDEAHNLTTEERTFEQGADNSRTAYQCLCKALNYFTGSPVFALFLSTYSRLSDFSPSQRHFWSSRGTTRTGPGESLNAPFVELPFDVFRDAESSSKLVEEDKYSVAEVCKLDFMARFGRPLFWTHMMHSSPDVTMDMAMQKLVLKLEDNQPLPYQVEKSDLLPLIAIRVDLTFESNRDEAIYLESLMVASSMRTVYSVPEHRQYLRGGYPSEPFLAEAAARNLFSQMRGNAESWHSVREAYRTNVPDAISKWLACGLVGKGERGELVARMLVTLAHDMAVINLNGNDFDSTPPSLPPSFSQPVSVVDFLSSLLSRDHLKKVLEARPDNMESGSTLKDAFKDACVHFTHFVRGEDDYILTDQACMIFMCRGAAMQGYNELPTTDLVIPVVMDKSKPLDRDNMSVIFIQVKNRVSKKKDAEMNVDEGKLSDFFSSKGDNRPYIAITMELDSSRPSTKHKLNYAARVEKLGRRIASQKEPPIASSGQGLRSNDDESSLDNVQVLNDTTTVNSKIQSHPRYRFIINGCSSLVYNVISSTSDDSYKMLLAYTGLLSEHPRQDDKYVKAVIQMKPYFRRGVSYDFVRMRPRSYFEQSDTKEKETSGKRKRPQQGGQGGRKKAGQPNEEEDSD
ncbi:hypothetical protein H0H92_002835 [Tricholoma furcatifolium]|nr:hypothetical protein H0H92_002835 [Tricholoma furcatifolium]